MGMGRGAAAVGDPVLDFTGGLAIDTPEVGVEVGVDVGMGRGVAVVGDPVLDVTGVTEGARVPAGLGVTSEYVTFSIT